MGTPGELNVALKITSDVRDATAGVDSVGNSVTQLETKTRAANAAMQQQRDAFDALAAKIDPVTAKLDELARLQVQLETAKGKGLVDDTGFDQLSASIDRRRTVLEKATEDAGKLSLASAGATREYGVLAGELARGNTARLEGSLLTLANRTGLLQLAFSATGVAIGSLVGGLGLLVFAAARVSAEQDQLNKAIALTGNYAGITSASVNALSQELSVSAGSASKSRTEILALASSGKVGTESLQAMAQASADLSTLTGASAEKSAQEVLKLFDGTAAGARKANDEYHFLNQEQYEHIRALEEVGDKEGAARAEAEAFDESVRPRIAAMTTQVTGLAAGWKNVAGFIKEAASTNWETFKSEASLALGTATDDVRIRDLQERKKNAAPIDAAGHLNFPGVINNVLGEGFGPDQQAELDRLQAKQKADTASAAKAGDDQKVQGAAVDAAATTNSIEKKFATPQEQKQAELTTIINAYNTRMAAALAKGDQTLYDQLQSKQAEEISRANAYYDKKGSKSGAPVDRAELSASTAQARQDLQRYTDAFTNAERVIDAAHKAGTASDADYYATKRKDIDDLEKRQVATLEQEKASVSAHGTTVAERIRIDQQVAGIDAQIDKARADASAKRSALDDQQHQNDLRRVADANRIQEAYLEATGHGAEAAQVKASQKYAPDLARAKLEGDTETTEKINVIIDVDTAKAQLAELKTQISATFSDEQRQQQDIQARLQAGVITQVDAQKQLIDLHQQTYNTLSTEVPKAQQLAQATNDPNAIRGVQQLTSQYNMLGLELDQITQQVQNTFQSAFENVFDSIGTRITTVRQLFTTLMLDIAQGIQRIAAQQLSQLATQGAKGAISQLSQWLGGSGETVADGAATDASATTSATAITTAGATASTAIGTAATSMAGAIVEAGTTAASAIATAGAGGSTTSGVGSLFSSLFSSSGTSGASADGSSSSFLSMASSLFGSGYGFDTGGYTGNGPWHEVAGVVHGGEHVTRAAVVAQPGVRPMLDDLNTHGMGGIARHVAGFAAGGYVAPLSTRAGNSPLFPNRDAAMSGARPPINLSVINVPHHSLVKDYLQSREGQEHILNTIDNNPSRIRRSIGG